MSELIKIPNIGIVAGHDDKGNYKNMKQQNALDPPLLPVDSMVKSHHVGVKRRLCKLYPFRLCVVSYDIPHVHHGGLSTFSRAIYICSTQQFFKLLVE